MLSDYTGRKKCVFLPHVQDLANIVRSLTLSPGIIYIFSIATEFEPI